MGDVIGRDRFENRKKMVEVENEDIEGLMIDIADYGIDLLTLSNCEAFTITDGIVSVEITLV